MNIVLLGSGNVATHLGKALKMAGCNIVGVWSRTFENALSLASLLQTRAIAQVSHADPSADVYIISVNDDAIQDVASAIPVKDKLVVHTSGSVDMDVLKDYSADFGVLYPLQTFSREKDVSFKDIPVILESSSERAGEMLKEIAFRLSSRVHDLSSEQRRILHVSAVFACNFTNHLYALADDLLQNHDLDFDLLRPLIRETSEKIQNHSPRNVQTGPAVRNDKKTMHAHLNALKNTPDLYKLYQLLSQSIVNLK